MHVIRACTYSDVNILKHNPSKHKRYHGVYIYLYSSIHAFVRSRSISICVQCKDCVVAR